MVDTQTDSTSPAVNNPSVLPGERKWAAALERISDEDRKLFNIVITTHCEPRVILEDVLASVNSEKEKCLKRRWKVKFKDRTVILRDVLGKLAVWVQKFMAIGDTAVQAEPTASLPWAAIRLVMQAVVNDVEVFGFVIVSLEDIANILGRSKIFELLYLKQTRCQAFSYLSEAVLALYASILHYLARILQYYGTNTAVRVVKSVGRSKKDIEDDFGSVEKAREETLRLAQLAEAEKSTTLLKKIGALEDQQSERTNLDETRYDRLQEILDELQQPINRIDAQLSELHDGLQQDTRAKILKAISTIPYATHHKVACQGRLPGSGTWLLKKAAYQSWQTSSSSSVLWLHGIPGSGKTKLTSLVVDNSMPLGHTAYFYCMRNPAEPQRAEARAILASLVRQLANTGPRTAILPPVLKQYESSIEGYAEFDDQSWSIEDCVQTILKLLESYPAVTIVLDALDEVGPDDRQCLLDALDKLLTESSVLLKLFISSRDNYDITLFLSGSPNIYIDANDNAGDIESFINDRLRAARLLHGKLSIELYYEIKRVLQDRARGMFRWVELQIQSLRQLKVATDIRSRLGSLPETLEATYWDMYQQIQCSGEHAADLANFTFQWLLYAQKTITIDAFSKLASALLCPSEDEDFTSAVIIDVCLNLVIIRENVLQFAHLSVREFLENIHKRHIEKMLPAVSNTLLARACLVYLRNSIKVVLDWSAEHNSCNLDYNFMIDESSQQQHMNVRYEDDSGASAKDNESTTETRSIRVFVSTDTQSLEEQSAVAEGVEAIENRSDADHKTTEGSSVEQSPAPDSRGSQQSNQQDANGQSTTGQDGDTTEPPITARIRNIPVSDPCIIQANRYAVLYWVYHVVESKEQRTNSDLKDLIRSFCFEESERRVWPGFDIWCNLVRKTKVFMPEGLEDAVATPANPIWLACLYDWRELVECCYEVRYGDARQLSGEVGQLEAERVIRSLDTSEWNPDTSYAADQKLVTPLVFAVSTGNVALTECILQCRRKFTRLTDTEVDVKVAPLLRAIEIQNVPLATTLLDDEEFDEIARSMVLDQAAWIGNMEILELILGRKFDITNLGYTALKLACRGHHIQAAMLLVEKGAPTLPGDEILRDATFEGCSEVVKFLLDRKIGLGFSSDALSIAVAHDSKEITAMLLEHGAKRDDLALVKQLKYGISATSLRLIRAGFDIHGRYLEKRRTALHYAAEQGFGNVVRELLERHVLLDVYDRDRNTPLHLAAKHGHDACVELLLDFGADVLAEDGDGMLPLDLAEKSRRTSTERIIRERMVKLMEELQGAKVSSRRTAQTEISDTRNM